MRERQRQREGERDTTQQQLIMIAVASNGDAANVILMHADIVANNLARAYRSSHSQSGSLALLASSEQLPVDLS